MGQCGNASCFCGSSSLRAELGGEGLQERMGAGFQKLYCMQTLDSQWGKTKRKVRSLFQGRRLTEEPEKAREQGLKETRPEAFMRHSSNFSPRRMLHRSLTNYPPAGLYFCKQVSAYYPDTSRKLLNERHAYGNKSC